jgi:PAS domain S-box-containing protein
MVMQALMSQFRRLFNPRWISVFSFLTIISIEALFIYLLTDRQIKTERQAVRKLAMTEAYLLQRQLDRSLSATFALASIVRQSQGNWKNFDGLAADLLQSYGGIDGGISRLQLAPDGIVQQIYPRSPRAGNETAIGHKLLEHPPDPEIAAIPPLTPPFKEEAIASRNLTVTKPIKLGQGNVTTIGYLPVFLNEETEAEIFWGFTIVEISISQLLEAIQFNQIVEQGYDYELAWVNPEQGDRTVFASSGKTPLPNPVSYEITVANRTWILSLSPKKRWDSRTLFMLEIPFIVLLAGLIAYLLYKLLQQPDLLRQQVALQVADLSRTNQQLTDEIRERQRIEQALRESEERFRVIANTTPIPLVISRCSDGLILYGNQALCQVFYIDPDRLIGSQTPDYYYDLADRDRLVADLQKYHKLDNYELQVKKGDGTPFWVAVYMQLLVFNGDRSIFAAFYDITERKQAEVQIRQALEREKELNQLKSYFISMTSHQFRTPLTKILGSAELLKSYSNSWTEAQKLVYFDRIEYTVEHMIGMLDDILLIAHAESGRLNFSPSPVNLMTFCQSLVEEFQLHHPTDPKIIFQIKGDCCKTQELPLLDPKLLEQILNNLLSNAIKYSDRDQEIYFAVNCQAEQLVFTIQDQGMGISSEEMPHLFEPFHRSKKVRKITGTGLGLAIVKKAADLHNAEITVDSQVGVGTTFTVTIPF